jgi:hypothetical protein
MSRPSDNSGRDTHKSDGARSTQKSDVSSITFDLPADGPPADNNNLRDSLLSRGSHQSMRRSTMRQSVSAFMTPGRSSSVSEPGKASAVSSMVNLANAILGVGLLALPRSFSQAGIAIGLVMLVGIYSINVLTCHCLTQAAAVAGRPATFKTVADRALRGFSLVVDLGVVITGVGAGCAYMLVAVDGFTNSFTRGKYRFVWVLVTAAIITPLSYLKKLDALRHTSLAAVLILIYITIIVVCFAAERHDDDPDSLITPCPRGNSLDACPPGAVDIANSGVDVLRAFTGLSLAFTCQAQVMPMWNELERPTTGRLLFVFAGALGLATTLYVTVALAGCGARPLPSSAQPFPAEALPSASGRRTRREERIPAQVHHVRRQGGRQRAALVPGQRDHLGRARRPLAGRHLLVPAAGDAMNPASAATAPRSPRSEGVASRPCATPRSAAGDDGAWLRRLPPRNDGVHLRRAAARARRRRRRQLPPSGPRPLVEPGAARSLALRLPSTPHHLPAVPAAPRA